MPFCAKKLSDEPIIIVTAVLPIEQHLPAFWVHMARLVAEHGAPLGLHYRWCVSVKEALHCIREVSERGGCDTGSEGRTNGLYT
jgi:hypothetical protein